ncbi:hypothetical protein MPSEU_000323000 [Mayamaea pseudoterrestris]|nr:hypothetical protein MPSEU_000323000 [Mayamaea pseudoterrestris]
MMPIKTSAFFLLLLIAAVYLPSVHGKEALHGGGHASLDAEVTKDSISLLLCSHANGLNFAGIETLNSTEMCVALTSSDQQDELSIGQVCLKIAADADGQNGLDVTFDTPGVDTFIVATSVMIGTKAAPLVKSTSALRSKAASNKERHVEADEIIRIEATYSVSDRMQAATSHVSVNDLSIECRKAQLLLGEENVEIQLVALVTVVDKQDATQETEWTTRGSNGSPALLRLPCNCSAMTYNFGTIKQENIAASMSSTFRSSNYSPGDHASQSTSGQTMKSSTDSRIAEAMHLKQSVLSSDSTTRMLSATDVPSSHPSHAPLSLPSRSPLTFPQREPSYIPSSQPSTSPSGLPSSLPSSIPSKRPTTQSPTNVPSLTPSSLPSHLPSTFLSSEPSYVPSGRPSASPSRFPSRSPSRFPSRSPSRFPSRSPSRRPSRRPTTMSPTKRPTMSPTMMPTRSPTMRPTRSPTMRPTRRPTMAPTRRPTKRLTKKPTRAPTRFPTRPPTWVTCGPSVRRAWHDTSCEDRAAYLRAVELLYKLPATNALNIPNYFDFVRMHNNANNSIVAHGALDGPFLPWHRWYLWKYEQALQHVSGTCLTVPYWDWTSIQGNATVFQAATFGTTRTGISRVDGCVIEGIASKNGFWTSTVKGGCLKRTFTAKYANFSTETDIARLIMNFPSFGRGLSGFSNNLQGAIHGVVHNWVGGHMMSMTSPDDPLFMLHHANVDRIWAIYQDYHNQDLIDKAALTDEEYSAGRGIGRDDPLPYFEVGSYPRYFWTSDQRFPTPRELHHSQGELVQVTYANDSIGLLLATMNSSYVAANNESWVQRATGPVSAISCSRRLDEKESVNGNPPKDVNKMLGIPEDTPPFSDIATRIMWSNLTSQGLSPSDALNTLAYRECKDQGDTLVVSPAWIAMQGMDKNLFKCFNQGEPSDCATKIDIVSSDKSLASVANPVQVLSFDETSVTVSLSQVWKPGALTMMALHYVDTEGFERCDTVQDVFTGEFASYKTQCQNGFTGVMLYATDATFPITAPAGWVTKLCRSAGVGSLGTLASSVTIPCSLEGAQCPLPLASEPICDGTPNYLVTNEMFDSSDAKGASSWIYSKTGKDDKLGIYLKPNSGTSKTFRVPTTANHLIVTLEVLKLNCAKSTKVSFLLGTEPVELGLFDCAQRNQRRFTSGKNVHVTVTSKANTADTVVLKVPPEMFSAEGRLTIGLQNSAIGIGSVSITADCTNQLPLWEDPKVVSIIDQYSEP